MCVWGGEGAGVGRALPLVIFDLPPTLTHPNPCPSVNEHEDPGAIADSVQMCMWRVGSCVQVVLLHSPRKWVVPLFWGVALMSLCAF